MLPSDATAKRNAVSGKISHALVGLVLLLKGWDKAEHFESHPFTVVFLLAAGAFIILGAAFLHPLERKIPNFSAFFHVAEGLALIVLGFALLEKSSRMPYYLFFVGAVYLGIGAFEFFTDNDEKKRLRSLWLTAMGGVFLLAALVFAVFNFFNSGNFWAYFTCGVLAVMGLFFLFMRRRTTQ